MGGGSEGAAGREGEKVGGEGRETRRPGPTAAASHSSQAFTQPLGVPELAAWLVHALMMLVAQGLGVGHLDHTHLLVGEATMPAAPVAVARPSPQPGMGQEEGCCGQLPDTLSQTRGRRGRVWKCSRREGEAAWEGLSLLVTGSPG